MKTRLEMIEAQEQNEPSLIGSFGDFPPGVTISHCGSPSSSFVNHSSSPSSKLPLGVSIDDSSEIFEILLDDLGRNSKPGVSMGSFIASLRECARTMYTVCGDREGDPSVVVLERLRQLGLGVRVLPLAALGRGEVSSIGAGERQT